MSEQSINTPISSPSRRWRTIFSMFCLVCWVIIMLLIHRLVKWFAPSRLTGLFKAFHRGCCWIFSISYEVEGEVSDSRPTLFLSNHISYLDVFVLGAVTPGFFIAKSEVAGWPILGSLAKVQNTLFFERKGSRIRGQLDVMSSHFNQDGNLILFPEGTSTEGEHVEPFKSSLLQAVENASVDVKIQALTIAYTHYKGKPMDPLVRDHYAWYGTMPFASHFFSALGMGKSKVKLTFHQPVNLSDFASRKECANHCWQQVNEGLRKTIECDAIGPASK